MKKNEEDSDLNSEQYYVLRGEGTEHPGSSSLNNEKRKGVYFAQVVELNYLNHQPNMKVDRVGHHFFNVFQEFLRPK